MKFLYERIFKRAKMNIMVKIANNINFFPLLLARIG